MPVGNCNNPGLSSLSQLSSDVAMLSPAFVPDVLQYTASVPTHVLSLQLRARRTGERMRACGVFYVCVTLVLCLMTFSGK